MRDRRTIAAIDMGRKARTIMVNSPTPAGCRVFSLSALRRISAHFLLGGPPSDASEARGSEPDLLQPLRAQVHPGGDVGELGRQTQTVPAAAIHVQLVRYAVGAQRLRELK